MNIGFDLDKIFVDYPPLVPSVVIDRLYRKKTNGELIYRIPSRTEQLLRQASHWTPLRPPIAKNITLLKSLRGKNHKLYLISSRFSFLKPQTIKLMKKMGFDKIFEDMYFNFDNMQPHEFKDKVLHKLNLDIYVDDDFHLLKYVAKRNKHTKFYWLTSRRKKDMLTRNITAVSNLSEIFPSHANT